jgi:glutaredoxin 3
MADVVIYTKPGCPYCRKAMDWYNAKGQAFEERNAQDNKSYRKEMFAYSNGDPTVPVIVVDGVFQQSGWEGRG